MLTTRFLGIYPVHDWTQLALIKQWCLSILTHSEISLSSINSLSSSILTLPLIVFKLVVIKWDSNGAWRGSSTMVNTCTESALTYWYPSVTCITSVASKPSPDCMFIHEHGLSTVGCWLGNIFSAFYIDHTMPPFQERSGKKVVAYWD